VVEVQQIGQYRRDGIAGIGERAAICGQRCAPSLPCVCDVLTAWEFADCTPIIVWVGQPDRLVMNMAGWGWHGWCTGVFDQPMHPVIDASGERDGKVNHACSDECMEMRSAAENRPRELDDRGAGVGCEHRLSRSHRRVITEAASLGKVVVPLHMSDQSTLAKVARPGANPNSGLPKLFTITQSDPQA
jgi:hypothetical protein